MNINTAARESGLPAKTIRYYEEIGLLPKAERQASGYRDYGAEDVELLAFVRRAREFGFSIEECRALVGLYRDPGRASHEVKGLVLEKIRAIEGKLKELSAVKAELQRLARACRGDEHPSCAILDALGHGKHG